MGSVFNLLQLFLSIPSLSNSYPNWQVSHHCHKWISHHAIILGVPETYISVPLLVAVAYCSQHTSVKMDFHTEPIVLYGLVGGRSGTNKSASLQL